MAASDATVLLLVWPRRRSTLIRGASPARSRRPSPDGGDERGGVHFHPPKILELVRSPTSTGTGFVVMSCTVPGPASPFGWSGLTPWRPRRWDGWLGTKCGRPQARDRLPRRSCCEREQRGCRASFPCDRGARVAARSPLEAFSPERCCPTPSALRRKPTSCVAPCSPAWSTSWWWPGWRANSRANGRAAPAHEPSIPLHEATLCSLGRGLENRSPVNRCGFESLPLSFLVNILSRRGIRTTAVTICPGCLAG